MFICPFQQITWVRSVNEENTQNREEKDNEKE